VTRCRESASRRAHGAVTLSLDGVTRHLTTNRHHQVEPGTCRRVVFGLGPHSVDVS